MSDAREARAVIEQLIQEMRAEAASPKLSPLPPEWADAANLAKGLCESEANRWESAAPSTAVHWRSVATRLGALYLAQDSIGLKVAEVVSQPPQERCDMCAGRWSINVTCVRCSKQIALNASAEGSIPSPDRGGK